MPTRTVAQPPRSTSARAARALPLLLCLALLAFVAPAVAQETTSSPAPTAAPASTPAAAPAASSPSCSDADLLRGALVFGPGLEGPAIRMHDTVSAVEGTPWDSPLAVKVKAGTVVRFDMRTPRSLQHLSVQGDDNDVYQFEISDDDRSYRTIWSAPPSTAGQGLRTRFVSLPEAAVGRYLRIRPLGGDGYYSISEVHAHCKAPTPWPPKLKLPPKVYGWKAIDNPMMVLIKGILAGFGTLVLLSYVVLRKRPQVLRRTRDALLVVVGVASFYSWWNLGHFHFDHYEHIWEHYHYYVGAKYGPELRFARLYECTAAADALDGLRHRVKKRKMRDLALTNELGTTEAILADPTRCTKHFTPERWQEFRKDIRFFRGRMSADRWDQSQNDHGYNGTPVWAILGRLIAENGGPLDWDKIKAIAWIDSALLVVMWMGVWWAFGWRAMVAALLYWGTNFPARFYWNGGSMLRYDWLMWLVLGICFLKKDKPFVGGMALTYATLLRIFPGFVVAAIILKSLARMVRERRFVLSREHQWFAAGCIAAMLVLFPASSWATGGLDAWGEFAQNSEKHLNTALTNNMGLKTVLGYDFPTRAMFMRDDGMSDPFKGWKDARAFYYAKSKPVLVLFLLLFCAALARAGDRQPTWVAACLGTGLIVMSSELTCYYYGFLLTFGLLWERYKTPAILMGALAAATCALSEMPWNDDHFAAMSLATVVAIVAAVLQIAFGQTPESRAEQQRADARTKAASAEANRVAPLPPAA